MSDLISDFTFFKFIFKKYVNNIISEKRKVSTEEQYSILPQKFRWVCMCMCLCDSLSVDQRLRWYKLSEVFWAFFPQYNIISKIHPSCAWECISLVFTGILTFHFFFVPATNCSPVLCMFYVCFLDFIFNFVWMEITF